MTTLILRYDMTEKNIDRQAPRTVEEAAQLLLSDLLIQHLQVLSQMTEGEFEILCDRVTPYLIDEFRLWQGNDALMNSCLSHDTQEADPARIILNKVKEILCNFHGFLVIT
jgi:hypothetical protein